MLERVGLEIGMAERDKRDERGMKEWVIEVSV